jgi:hypothetical protein
MSQSRCGKGQPATAQVAFEALPREIRDSIYTFALVASSPIIVWSAQLKRTFPLGHENFQYRGQRTYTYKRHWDHEAMISSRKGLGLGLLQCNRTIALEAAQTFYGQNTFAFDGHHEWIPVISWLDAIGDVNRSLLTRLEARQRNPTKAWQYPDGTRVSIHIDERNEIYPRNPHFPHLDVVPEGEVDSITPLIEMIFLMLGQCETGNKLVFALNLEYDLVPGTVINDMTEDADIYYSSMDLPNLIEKWRVDYTTGTRRRPVEVIWKAECLRILYNEKKGLIEDLGWDILEQEEAEKSWQIESVDARREDIPDPTMKFTLKRKALVGPLVASEPSSWSWRSGPDWTARPEP